MVLQDEILIKKKENNDVMRPFRVYTMPDSDYTLILLLWINIFSEFKMLHGDLNSQ